MATQLFADGNLKGAQSQRSEVLILDDKLTTNGILKDKPNQNTQPKDDLIQISKRLEKRYELETATDRVYLIAVYGSETGKRTFLLDGQKLQKLLQDDTESAQATQTLFVDYDNNEEIYDLSEVFTESNVIMISPAGKPISLPKSVIPSFTGSVKNSAGETYDLGIQRGSLLAFKEGSDIYSSSFSKVDESYTFKGYKLVGSDPAEYRETIVPTESENLVLIGAEDEYCFLGIYSGYYQYTSNETSTPYLASGTISSSSIALRNQENEGWIRIDNGCVRDIELATVDPSYIDILKNGFVIVDPDDSNGMMFSYQKEVGDYEAGDATGYIYRRQNNEGGEDYFKWTGIVWERFELSDENQLDVDPNIITMLQIWESIKDDPIHSSLDLAGFIPVIGMAADGLNAVIYYVEGDKLAAALSSVAIISSGIVVGVKAVVKVVKTTKAIKTAAKLSDEFASGMESLLVKAKGNFVGQDEVWMRYQSNLLELAERHGEDGMTKLLNLSDQIDEVKFLQVADEMNSLENSSDFMADLANADFAAFIKESGSEGVSSWKVLDETSSFKSLRTDIPWLTRVNGWNEVGIGVAEFNGKLSLASKETGEVFADFVKNGSDEFLEIDVDNFLPYSAPTSGVIDWSETVTLSVKSASGETITGAIAKTSDGTFGFVENVSSYGSEVVQNTITQRSLLRGQLSGIKATEEAHHLIPVELLKENDVVRKAVEDGFDFNGAANGIPLEKYVNGAGRHARHDAYTGQVRKAIEEWVDLVEDYTPADAKKFLTDLIGGSGNYQGLRSRISSTSGKLDELNLLIP